MKSKILARAGDEESSRLVERIEAGKIQVAAVHQVNAAGLEKKLVEDVNLVDFRGFDSNEGRNVALQVEQCMHLDGSILGAITCPGEKRQAEIDGGGVEGVDGLLQLHAKVFVGVQGARHGNQHLRQVGVNPIVAQFVGVGERAARDVAANPGVIKSRTQGAQTNFDLAQTLAPGQLGKSQAEKLVPASEGADFVIAAVTIHTTAKLVRGNEIHQLREDRFACLHASLPPVEPTQHGQKGIQNSNRKRFVSSAIS